jgi:hypothetical protein
MDAYMTLGDYHEPGHSGVFAFGGIVSEDIRLGDAGHIQRFGIIVQEIPDQVLVPHLADISAVTVDNQVHPTSGQLLNEYAK